MYIYSNKIQFSTKIITSTSPEHFQRAIFNIYLGMTLVFFFIFGVFRGLKHLHVQRMIKTKKKNNRIELHVGAGPTSVNNKLVLRTL